jgi:DNA-directed RNA polymerase subunit L
VNMKIRTHNHIYIITLLFIFSSLLSCQSSMTPLQVSEKFWSGIQKKNISLITIYSISDSGYSADDIKQLPDVNAITFGKIIIDADIAEIQTQVTITSNDKTVDIPLKTYLEREDDVWRVNYKQSVLLLKTNQGMIELLGGVQELTEELAEEIEESVEEFKEKTMPEIESQLEQAEETLRDKIPEFKNMLDELLEGLKRSIEEAFPPKKEEPKTRKT